MKVAFFRGASLSPVPPGASKQKDVRYLDIHEGEARRSAVRRLGEAGEQIAGREDVRRGTVAMKKVTSATRKSGAKDGEGEASPSDLIDAKIAALGDWRGEVLSRVRRLIKAADPEIVEAVKWRKPSNPSGVPVWEHGGIVCTGETYKDKVKLTFARGAALEDPSGLFNSSLDGNLRRAIDIRRGRQDRRDGVEGAHSRGRGAERLRRGQDSAAPFPEAAGLIFCCGGKETVLLCGVPGTYLGIVNRFRACT